MELRELFEKIVRGTNDNDFEYQERGNKDFKRERIYGEMFDNENKIAIEFVILKDKTKKLYKTKINLGVVKTTPKFYVKLNDFNASAPTNVKAFVVEKDNAKNLSVVFSIDFQDEQPDKTFWYYMDRLFDKNCPHAFDLYAAITKPIFKQPKPVKNAKKKIIERKKSKQIKRKKKK